MHAGTAGVGGGGGKMHTGTAGVEVWWQDVYRHRLGGGGWRIWAYLPEKGDLFFQTA